MSEYWKSQAKKYCDYCKVWISDNKPSINIHETGKTHRENVQKKLQEIKKQSNAKRAEQKKYDSSLAAIERAAMDAMENDLSENPSLKKQYGAATVKAAQDYQPPPPEPKKEKQTVVKPKPKPKPESSEAVKRKTEPEPEAKIGKWQKIDEPRAVVEKKAPAMPIDLQLPTKGPAIKSNPEETTKVEEEVDTKPKTKWVSAFQEVEEPKPAETSLVKSEPIDEPKLPETPIGVPESKTESTVDAAKSVEAEKIVTLKSEKSSKKSAPVVFKKRKNDGQNMRERLDD